MKRPTSPRYESRQKQSVRYAATDTADRVLAAGTRNRRSVFPFSSGAQVRRKLHYSC
jgi:hypothetical protein